MIEKKSKDNIINRCKFCGWKFPNDLLEKINENSDSLFCELCGAEIRYNNVKNQEKDKKIEIKSDNDLSGTADKSKSSPWKRFYETIKKFVMETEGGEVQEGLKKRQKESIARVFNDNDFPKIFRENFIIVFSRITYFELKKQRYIANLKNNMTMLTKADLKALMDQLKLITVKNIKPEFLENLHNISQNDFEEWLKKLQAKLKKNPNYYEEFITYIQWLIKTVVIIVSNLWDNTNLPKFERIIRDDLRSYNFKIYNNTRSISSKHSNNNIYDENFKAKIYNNFEIILSNLPLSEEERYNTLKKSKNLFKLALDNGLTPEDMGNSKNAPDLSIILIYYGLISLGITIINNKKVSAKAIGKFLEDKNIEIGLTSSVLKNLSPGKLYPFISDGLEVSLKQIKYPRMIISFNHNFKRELIDHLNTVVFYLPFSEVNRNKIEKEAIKLFEYALENGLNPSDLGINKSANFLSIILTYFSLISLGIKRIKNEKVSKNAIWRCLGVEGYKKIGLSKGSRTNIHTSYFEPFLPNHIKTLISNKSHPHQLSYQEIKSYTESIGYVLLTNKEEFYINKRKEKTSPSQTRIKIQCENGHEWNTKYGNLWVRKGCRVCKGLSIQTYEDINEFVESLGGILITSRSEFNIRRKNDGTIPTRTKITVQCENEHKWETTKDRLNGHWCPECIGLKPWKYKDIRNYILKLGGELVSNKEEYELNRKNEGTIPVKTKIRVKCRKGHIWETTKDRLRVSWCPKCKEGKYESNCRWYFEKIFTYISGSSIQFLKIRLHRIAKMFKCTQNFEGISLNKMHFDGFAIIKINGKKIRLAFEYNGPQHYIFPNHIHKFLKEGRKRFEHQQLVDEFKRLFCMKNHIILIEFPYYIDENMNHPKKIQKYIIKQFVNKTRIELNEIPQFNHI